MDRLPDMAGQRDMVTGAPFPASGVTSCNAYLGAFPSARALAAGARIVIDAAYVGRALADLIKNRDLSRFVL